MDKEKLEQEPAFARMPKRFYAACAAMQGMLANKGITDAIISKQSSLTAKQVISIAYTYVDELLRQE